MNLLYRLLHALGFKLLTSLEYLKQNSASAEGIINSFAYPEEWEEYKSVEGVAVQYLYQFGNMLIHCNLNDDYANWSYIVNKEFSMSGKGFAILQPVRENFNTTESDILTKEFKKMLSLKNKRNLESQFDNIYSFEDYGCFVEDLIQANPAYALTSPDEKLRKLAEKVTAGQLTFTKV